MSLGKLARRSGIVPHRVPAGGGGQAGGVLFGSSYPDKAGTPLSIYQGRCQVSRHYFQNVGGVNGAADSSVQAAYNDGVRTMVISWKDQNTTNVGAFLDTFPAGVTLYGCFNHEPENDAGTPGTQPYIDWSNQWKSLTATQATVMRNHNVIPTAILMGFTLYAGSNRNITDWFPGAGVVDVWGWDGYYDNRDPADLLSRIGAACQSVGATRTLIGETGSIVTDAQRTTKTATYKSLVKSFQATYGVKMDLACYWNSYDTDTSGNITADFRLLNSAYYSGNANKTTTPTAADWDTATADAWFGPVGG